MCGIVVPTAEQLHQKKLALITGLTTFITVMFGIVAVKGVNIPMFLAFRRCSFVTTVLLMWLISNQRPNHSTSISSTLVTAGAVFAGWDSLDRDWFGFLLVWMNNLTQSASNLVVSNPRFSHISVFGKHSSLFSSLKYVFRLHFLLRTRLICSVNPLCNLVGPNSPDRLSRCQFHGIPDCFMHDLRFSHLLNPIDSENDRSDRCQHHGHLQGCILDLYWVFDVRRCKRYCKSTIRIIFILCRSILLCASQVQRLIIN
jgi:hypothetical protein